jgi:hypothetical protein
MVVMKFANSLLASLAKWARQVHFSQYENSYIPKLYGE